MLIFEPLQPARGYIVFGSCRGIVRLWLSGKTFSQIPCPLIPNPVGASMNADKTDERHCRHPSSWEFICDPNYSSGHPGSLAILSISARYGQRGPGAAVLILGKVS